MVATHTVGGLYVYTKMAADTSSLLNCTSLKFSDSFQLSSSLLSRRPMAVVKFCAHSNA